MQEVIRIEPRAGSAWSVLAQCYEDMGEMQKALQLRIMAAHLNQDPEEWYRLADESRYGRLSHSIPYAHVTYSGAWVITDKPCIVIASSTS